MGSEEARMTENDRHESRRQQKQQQRPPSTDNGKLRHSQRKKKRYSTSGGRSHHQRSRSSKSRIDEESIFSIPELVPTNPPLPSATTDHNDSEAPCYAYHGTCGNDDGGGSSSQGSSSHGKRRRDGQKRRRRRKRRHESASSQERVRRYIYAAISSTFCFVVFREVGWIDRVHSSRVFTDAMNAPHYFRGKSNDHDYGDGGSAMSSLASAAASMAATSMTTTAQLEKDAKSASGQSHLWNSQSSFVSRSDMMEHVTQVDTSIVRGSRPVMYTFFEWIPPRNRGTQMSDTADKALIAEWKAAWKAAGWEPRVLTLEDAKQHPQYDDYAPKLNSIRMLGVDGLGGNVVYNQLCFLRWLAMAAAGGGYMCDYDVFPVSRAPKSMDPPYSGNFTVYCKIKFSENAGIPCLLSGRSDEWTRMAYALLDNGLKNSGSESMWSDMLALIDMRNDKAYRIHDAVLEGQDVLLQHGWTPQDCNVTKHKKAIHFSHEAMRLGYLNPGESAEDRPDIIRRFLTHWNQACGETETME